MERNVKGGLRGHLRLLASPVIKNVLVKRDASASVWIDEGGGGGGGGGGGF